MVVTILLAICFLLVGAVSAQTNEIEVMVHGTVVNAVSHEPIGRALVHSTDNHFATLTNADGHFEFTIPKMPKPALTDHDVFVFGPRGYQDGASVWLVALKPGFLDDPNRTTQIAALPDRDITIPLWPEALIKGRVTVSGGQPAVGIDVQIFSTQISEGIAHWQPGASTRTSSDGEFRFAELPAGTYKLVTREALDDDPATTVPGGQLYGLPPVCYPGMADFSAAPRIQLSHGQVFQADIALERQRYFPVRIPVSGLDSRLLNSGLGVTVSAQGHRGPGFSLGYNPVRGSIEGLLPSGSYVVEATTGDRSASGTANLTIAGAAVNGNSLVLVRSGSITINVTEQFTSTDWQGSSSWSDGKHTYALKGPRVYLQVNVESADDFQNRGGAMLRSPTGPNDDSLVIDNILPGRYWLRTTTSRGYVASATMGEVDLLHEPFVFLSSSTAPIEITMRDDSAELDGTLTGIARFSDPTIKSPASAYVYCVPLPDSSGHFQQVWVSNDGTFKATIAPGTYRVLAFRNPQGNLLYRDVDAMRAYENQGQVVHLVAGQKTNVELQVIAQKD